MFVYVSEIATNAPPAVLWLTAAALRLTVAAPRHPEIAQTARLLHQTRRWRWPGNHNGRSTSAICLFTFARSQLTLWRRLRGWRRSFKRHVADVKNITGGGPAMTRIDRSSTITNNYAYEIKQNLSKNIFLLIGRHYYDDIAHCFFPTITRNDLCSHLQKNNFLTTLTPTEKPRYTYWRVFCRFYLQQNHRYHNKKILIFNF